MRRATECLYDWLTNLLTVCADGARNDVTAGERAPGARAVEAIDND